MDSGRGWDSPPAPPAAQPTLQGGGGHHPPRPTEELVPQNAKGAPVNEGTTAPGNPPVQRQRWGRQYQSPHHPRLGENHKRSLIGGPRKMGVQGGDSMENEAEGPKFDLWLPPVPLWLLSGHPERSSPPQRRNTPNPTPQVPTHRALVRWTAEEGGTPSPRLLGRSQRSRVVKATTPSTTEELVPHRTQRRVLKRRNHHIGKPTQAAAAVGGATSIPIPPAPLRQSAMQPNWRPP